MVGWLVGIITWAIRERKGTLLGSFDEESYLGNLLHGSGGVGKGLAH